MTDTSHIVPSFPRSLVPSSLREAPTGDSAVPRLELLDWASRHGIVAGITARGKGPAAFNLGLWSSDAVGQVMTRWRAFRAAMQPGFPAMVLSHQVHGTAVRWHERPAEGWLVLDGLDGHATNEPGVLLCVTVADCPPVYLAVPRTGAVALVHAGWRGTAGGILERAVELLRARAFATASEIVMHCGVGICGDCYEVGSEVAAKFAAPAGAGPIHLDLREVLVRQARELGLTDISVSPSCSAHDRERFFSHRASGGRDGRMVAYLGRPA